MRDDVELVGGGSSKIELVGVDGYDCHLILHSIATSEYTKRSMEPPFHSVMSRLHTKRYLNAHQVYMTIHI